MSLISAGSISLDSTFKSRLYFQPSFVIYCIFSPVAPLPFSLVQLQEYYSTLCIWPTKLLNHPMQDKAGDGASDR